MSKTIEQQSGMTGRVPWYAPVFVALCALPIIALSQFEAHLRIDPMDDGYFAYVGWRLTEGDQLYVDVWDNKPPGVFWLNQLAFAIFGDGSYLGPVVLTTVALCAGVAAFYAIARRLYRPGAGGFATVLFTLYFTHGAYHGGSNRIETYLAVAELLAVMCFIRGLATTRWYWLVGAGALAAAAALLKQTGVAAMTGILAYLVYAALTRHVTVRATMIALGSVLAGVLLAIGAAAAVLAGQGILSEAYDAAIAFNGLYFRAGVSEVGYNHSNYLALRRFVLPVLTLPLLGVAIAWLHGVTKIPQVFRKVTTRPLAQPMLLWSVWLLVATFSAMNAPHGYRYYLLPLIPPMLLILADLLNEIQGETAFLSRIRQRVTFAAAFVLILFYAGGAFERQVSRAGVVWSTRQPQHVGPAWHDWETEPQPWQIAAANVRDLTDSDDAIHVWGYWPYVYLEARRPCASRFFITDILLKLNHFAEDAPPDGTPLVTNMAEEIRTELRTTLIARPPALLLLNYGNHGRLIDRDQHDSLTDPLEVWLVNWLADNYSRVDVARPGSGFVFYRRNPDVSGAGAIDRADLSPDFSRARMQR